MGCHNYKANVVKEVRLGLHNNNELKIQLDITTIKSAEVSAEYWADSIKKDIFTSASILPAGLTHRIVLCNIIPETNYSYRLITNQNGIRDTGKIYNFRSVALPIWLQDQFKYSCNQPELLPQKFKDGFMLLNKKETPGIAYIVDYKGRLRWYQVIENTGLKVVHFTKDKTILTILGRNDEPTSYGSEIMEFNMLGDTLIHLKKGQGDFVNTIHHEILKNGKRQLVTIFEDKKIMDLSSVGGSKKDTVSSDGIIVMDSTGKRIWQWSVFDVMDPLKDPNILKTKSDWTHANSLNYDLDSNYIISFYNTGQIWKVNATTGRLIWNYGKGGDFKIPADGDFSESHAVHINAFGNLMFFDNGVPKEQSQVFVMKLDQQNKTAETEVHIKLPPLIYNARMGSAYMIDENNILCCCSKRHIAVLVNKDGKLTWTLDVAVPPYRVEFLAKEQVSPWLQL
ncbi:MAG: aryl-sulfate sulfotransferase [Ferruginibacter sp.]